MELRGAVDFVRLAETGIGVLDHAVECERRHEGATLPHAGGPLGVRVCDREAGIRLLLVVLAGVANLLQNKAGSISLWIAADRSVPGVVVPGHADRDVT